MKQNQVFASLCLMFSIAACAKSQDMPQANGSGDSGGGMGVIEVKPARRVTLFDSHDVRYSLGAEMVDLANSEDALNFALDRIREMDSKDITAEEVSREIEEIQGQIKFLETGPDFKRDTHAISLYDGASLIQIAYYDGEKQELLVNRGYWEQLNGTDRAMLLVHEAIYKIFRNKLNIHYSDEVRKLVGYLFVDKYVDQINDLWRYKHREGRPAPGSFFHPRPLPSGALLCQSIDSSGKPFPRGPKFTQFYVYKNEAREAVVDSRYQAGVPCFGDCLYTEKSESSFQYSVFEWAQGIHNHFQTTFSIPISNEANQLVVLHLQSRVLPNDTVEGHEIEVWLGGGAFGEGRHIAKQFKSELSCQPAPNI